MNDNPGETPNPLNSAPGAVPEQNAGATDVVDDVASASNVNVGQPTTQPVSDASINQTAAQSVEIAQQQTAVASLDPTGRTMNQAAEISDTPKPKKTGLIVGIIIGAVALIGIIVAVILVMLNMNKANPVETAMQKLLSGNAPQNVAIDGDINILVNDRNQPLKRINIDLDSDIVVGSMINTSSAVLTITDWSDKDYSIKFEEIYAANGDLFFMIDGATAALEDSGLLNLINPNSTPTTNCVTDESGATNCETPIVEVDCAGDVDCMSEQTTVDASNLLVNTIMSVIEAADGTYLRISTDELNFINESSNSQISCVTDFISNVNKNSNSTLDLYNKSPFVKASDKSITISSLSNPVYQVNIDSQKFADFINAMQNTELAGSLYSCLGWSNHAYVDVTDVDELVSQLPELYVEVNDNNDFSRIYLESDINDGVATATIDLGLSYPTNVNASEPVEYTDYSTFIETLFKDMYQLAPGV